MLFYRMGENKYNFENFKDWVGKYDNNSKSYGLSIDEKGGIKYDNKNNNRNIKTISEILIKCAEKFNTVENIDNLEHDADAVYSMLLYMYLLSDFFELAKTADKNNVNLKEILALILKSFQTIGKKPETSLIT